MARHSHWHNIQATKGKVDAKRAKTFAKLAKSITAAAKDGGGDPGFNIRLRVAIDTARKANMPKDKIERAVARGTGEGEMVGQIEEVVYEGFGPGGSALLVQCLTDNRNRSNSEVRTVMNKTGGNMAGQGAVSWMFEKKGLAFISDTDQVPDQDAFELAMIDAGADEIKGSEQGIELTMPVSAFKEVIDTLERASVNPESATLAFVPKETVTLTEEDSNTLEALIDRLEELDDVDTVYTNTQ